MRKDPYALGAVQAGEDWALLRIPEGANEEDLVRALRTCGMRASPMMGFLHVRLGAPIREPDGWGRLEKAVSVLWEVSHGLWVECIRCGRFRPGVVAMGRAICDACMAEEVVKELEEGSSGKEEA